jgi:hypothetical protein
MVVAELIDPAELEKLIGVNRAFFDIVMDNRYREVKLIDLDPVDLFRKVDALKYVLVVTSCAVECSPTISKEQ